MTLEDLESQFMTTARREALKGAVAIAKKKKPVDCLLYTSDAADE